MTDGLSAKLQAATTELTLAGLPAAEVRAAAEKRRSVHRIVGGVILFAVALAVVVGSSVLVSRHRSEPAARPVVPVPAPSTGVEPSFYEILIARDGNVVLILESTIPGDRAIWKLELALQSALTGQQGRCNDNWTCRDIGQSEAGMQDVYELNPDPALTAADLRRFERLSVMMEDRGTWERVADVGSAPPRLTGCLPDLTGLPASQLRTAAYIATGLRARPSLALPPIDHANLNEYVLRFDTVAAASAAYAALYKATMDCPTHTDYKMIPVWLDSASTPLIGRPIDDMLAVEFRRSG